MLVTEHIRNTAVNIGQTSNYLITKFAGVNRAVHQIRKTKVPPMNNNDLKFWTIDIDLP